MLLDESPSPTYGSMKARLEPWAEEGSLVACLSSARSRGRASLYLVYISDPRPTWGSRVVTAVAGGCLYTDERPGARLRYEVVARTLFRNIVGKDTTLPFRVLVDACLAPDPDRVGGALLKSGRKHESLGYPVPQIARSASGEQTSASDYGNNSSYGTGVRIKWVDQTGCVRCKWSSFVRQRLLNLL